MKACSSSPVGFLLVLLVLLSEYGRHCPAFLRTQSGFGRSLYTSTTFNSPNNVTFGRVGYCSKNRPFRTTFTAKKKGRKTEKGGKESHTTGDKMHKEGRSTKGTERDKKEEDFGDILKNPNFLKRKIELMEKQLEEKRIEIDAANKEGDKEWEEWGPMIERLEREFDVVKERMISEARDIAGIAKACTLKEVVAVSDNLARATGSITPMSPGAQKIKDHYDMIEKSMQEVFDKLGMKTVPTVGEPFNYEVHQAVMSRPSEYEEDIICQELSKGFVVDGKLIRPAMVAVSTG